MPKNQRNSRPCDEEAAELPRRPDISKLRIRQFDPDEEGWEFYFQYFELELFSAGIQNKEDLRTALLTEMGAGTFKRLVDHFRPHRVFEITHAELVAELDKYYADSRSVTTDRVEFTLRKREENEKIKDFINVRRGRCTVEWTNSSRYHHHWEKK